ncbi:Rid family hydrolase [Nitrospirillum pindoramense]|uniref:Enamine deaminase RidA (YjgF/YER057c/UK114 family) n=1 Tax=Nitrospirillum amazonense TaxID=28077 RepID=A0A560HC86_9PROT|nr:Rid family hydrolase [Nitrospirillum amazonense]TWB43977.1 enamine deaminase RidA (YjgF/YER057c/UK114 family) [Nitrospirillum amazonense]
MPDIIKIKTGNKFEDHGSYSRLVAVDDLIFVSNTAGRNPRTKVLPDDPAEQALQALSNIEGALAAVGATLEDVVAARVFVQFPQDVEAVMTAYGNRMRGINPTLTMTCPPLGSLQYKVEIEVTAWRGASKADVKEMRITL